MVEGVKELTANLTVNIPKHVREAMRDAMEKGATETVAMMKRLVPVATGELRDSIGWTWGDAPAGSMVIGTVGTTKYATMRIVDLRREREDAGRQSQAIPAGALIEFGTKAACQGQPYFFPCWRTMKKRTLVAHRAATRQAIKKGATSTGSV